MPARPPRPNPRCGRPRRRRQRAGANRRSRSSDGGNPERSKEGIKDHCADERERRAGCQHLPMVVEEVDDVGVPMCPCISPEVADRRTAAGHRGRVRPGTGAGGPRPPRSREGTRRKKSGPAVDRTRTCRGPHESPLREGSRERGDDVVEEVLTWLRQHQLVRDAERCRAGQDHPARRAGESMGFRQSMSRSAIQPAGTLS